MDSEFPFEPELETGAPFLPGAQRPIACTHMIEDATTEVVTETLVFPNFIFFFQHEAGARFGRSVMVSPGYARSFKDALPDIIEHVNGCDCPRHIGRSMDFVPCD